MRTLARGAVLIVLVLVSLSSYAALSPKFVDWGKGPARWLMTRDEQKKWKSIDTDDAAQAFIDLFWARRDPTPGTYVNEYRREFDSRVKYAEQNLGHKQLPGPMSDEGHAVIVLGFPTNNGSFMKENSATSGGAAGAYGAGSHGTMMGEREVWLWEKEDARKFDMPKIEAVFIKDPITGLVQRDTQRNEIMTAYVNAMEKAIVDRNMTVAPEWAKQPPVTLNLVETTRAAAPESAKAFRKGAAGVHSLVLIKNAAGLAAPQGGSDPFAGVSAVESFATSDDLGYAFEYCGGSETLTMTITITGTAGGRKINMVAPTEEVPVEAIKVVPGCNLVRASIPLADMQVTPGTYTFNIKLQDGPQSYNLSQNFRIE